MRGLLIWLLSLISVGLIAGETRNIEVMGDNDAQPMVSKIYVLKHARASDLYPYVSHAVKSSIGQDDVEVANVSAFQYGETEEDALMVTMKESISTYVDELIQIIDKPGIVGSGIFNYDYTLKNRVDMEFFTSVLDVISTEARFTAVNGERILWKSNKGWGILAVKWLERFDILPPRAELTFNVYEISEDNVKDFGIDYAAWMVDVQNGSIEPYRHMFTFTNSRGESSETSSDGYNDFQINGSFLRMLQRKGIARIATTGSLMVKNGMNPLKNPLYNPALPYHPISNSLTLPYNARISLVSSPDSTGENDVTELEIKCSPELFLNNAMAELKWSIKASNVGVEHYMKSKAKLAYNEEKLLFTFSRSHDVTQYSGMPFLGEIPVIKYLVGSEVTSKMDTQVYVTVTVTPVIPDSLPEEAKQVVSKSKALSKKSKAIKE